MQDVIVQGVSLLGSLLILAAFIAAQMGKMRTSDLRYVVLNLVGSGILAIVAIIEQQWGFLLLEGTWAVVSAWSIARMQYRA
ncbi:MAG TPA: hypothetical protein VLQ48_00920 [Chloroflexia bacterium]|nr:hypothetical protein [Chloroflexia bacterium]